jgi:hypothetical protein
MCRSPLALSYLGFDDFVKNRQNSNFVIPAKAGIQIQDLDPGFRWVTE